MTSRQPQTMGRPTRTKKRARASLEETKGDAKSSVPVEQRKRLALFVVKLLDIIETTDDTVIRWGGSETSVIIEKPHELSKVLSTFFQSSKVTSFVRQLNFYGFHKFVKNKQKNEFTHENFQRGDWDALALIKRRHPKSQEPSHTSTMCTERQMDKFIKDRAQAEQARDIRIRLANMKLERDAARKEVKQLQQQVTDLQEHLRQAQAARQGDIQDVVPLTPAPTPAPAPFEGGLYQSNTNMKPVNLADPTSCFPVLDNVADDIDWLINLTDLGEAALDI